MFEQRGRMLDDLNRMLLITGLVLSILGSLVFSQMRIVRMICSGVAAILLILVVLRMFSKNTQKRNQENMKYLTVVTAIKTWFQTTFRGQKAGGGTAHARRAKKVRKNPTWSEIKQYKYFICPQCAQRLRVPRGKGRIRVTCTHCGNVFETKS